VQHGFNELAGADVVKITDSFSKMKSKQSDFNIDLYGNGHASENILNCLMK